MSSKTTVASAAPNMDSTLNHTDVVENETVQNVASGVAIDNKIEQAMDLVKTHLLYAVREEVEVLKERIVELETKISRLESENKTLRKHAPIEIIQYIQEQQDQFEQQQQQQQQNTPHQQLPQPTLATSATAVYTFSSTASSADSAATADITVRNLLMSKPPVHQIWQNQMQPSATIANANL